MLAILVIAPLVIAAFLAVILKKYSNIAKHIALVASVLSLLLIANITPNQIQTIPWFGLSGYVFTFTLSTMPMNLMLLLLVGVITPLIVLYSIGFMNLPSEQPRYYFELCMFAASMMLFAISGGFLAMFIGWELLGVTSYLLIGFWYRRHGTADAARKAITTVLIGDILMLSAIIIIWGSYHTFSFVLLLQRASIGNNSIAVALALVIFASFTKSAQFPFHEWLPDAMKGPTPVSAFLHSSTMVKAGVFLVAVLLPLFAAYHLLYLLLLFGLITTILGVTNALVESNIKRVLAYSTIEDLGLMFVALGLGSLIAAMMLFVVQTFYKALLFMDAGSMIKANDSEEDMDRLYNAPKYKWLLVPIVIGVVSLAGLYPVSGFFGKAAVDASANNMIIYAVLLAIGLGSSLYIFRWMFVPLRKKSGRKADAAARNYRTLPVSMILPMYILSLFVLLTGFAVYRYLPVYLGQYGYKSVYIGVSDILVSTAIVIIGFLVSYQLFYRKGRKIGVLNPVYNVLYNNMIVNRAYVHIAGAVSALSGHIDRFDYAVYNVIRDGAHNVGAFGNMIKKAETGSVNAYVLAFVIGLIIIVAVLVL